MDTVVTKNHPNANINAVATRDMDADFGVGTLRRETPNMLPTSQTRVRLAGFTQPKWNQSAARENKGGVLPHSKPASVYARSGNQDLAAIGLAPQALALMGGEEAAPAAPAAVPAKGILVLGAILGAFYLFSK